MTTNDDYLQGRYAPNWRAEAARHDQQERERRQRELQSPLNNAAPTYIPPYRSPEEKYRDAAPMIATVGVMYLFIDLLLLIFMVTSCQLSYTHLTGKNCMNTDNHYALFNSTKFQYYIQPFNGVCQEKSTLQTGKCIEWSNTTFWEEFARYSDDTVDGAKEKARYADVAYMNLIIATSVFGALSFLFHTCQLRIPMANIFGCFSGLMFYLFCITTFKLLQDCSNRNTAIGYAYNWQNFYDCEEVISGRMKGARLASACIAFGSIRMILSLVNICALGKT